MARLFRKSPEAMAARMWVRQHSGSWDERDAKEFEQWLQAAPEHRVIYERVVAACELAKVIPAPPPQEAEPSRPPLSLHWRTLGIALLICIIFIPGWRRFSDWWNGTPVTWTAPFNASRTVSMSDGTQIVLDAGTQLITQWDSHLRHATVVQGEALFSVSHDSMRPLTVDAGRGHLADLGTVFDVETRAHSVKVSVLEGSVGVRTRHGEVVLTAGHGSGYTGTGELLPVTHVDESVTSWQQGVRRFDSAALADVLDMLSRRHGVQLTVTDDAAAKLRLSGTLRMDDLQLSLRTLGTALQLEVRWIDDHHVELSSKRMGD